MINCRYCNKKLKNLFLDLGFAPFSNSYLNSNDLNSNEIYYPLKVFFCDKCWFVQSSTINHPKDIFTKDYAYFSSISKSFLDHSKKYSDMIIDKLGLNSKSFVIELASNDGYLLKNFNKRKIPNLGIEPTLSTANYAIKKGINTIIDFFSYSLSKKIKIKYKKADLIIANNVYAHVPNIIDFTKGIKNILNSDGIVTIEFPHLKSLIEKNYFDTIYHEHYSYLTLKSVNNIFNKCGLKIYDVEKILTQGGGLRIYGCLAKSKYKISKNVKKIAYEEFYFGLSKKEVYLNYQKKINKIKYNSLNYLINQKNKNKFVLGFGAAAKGNTFINFLGLQNDLIKYICDSSSSKQGLYLPGSHIPIISPRKIKSLNPDVIVIFPWNIKNEIIFYLKNVLKWKGSVVTFLPKLSILKI